mgnify:CR=1 FL=1
MGAPCKIEASRRSIKLSLDGSLVRQASVQEKTVATWNAFGAANGSFADEYSTF